MDIPDGHQQILLDVARTGIREELTGLRQYQIPTTPDPIFSMPAGCFVTLHERSSHRLRGCIGRLQSPDPLIKGIYEVARSVIHDPRFVHNPITAIELSRLDLEVSVLSPLKDAAHVLDFDPPNDGIYLIHSGRTGTFLPQVARETGWTREQLLARLCSEKLGLAPNAWQDPQARLLTYKVVLIGPVPFVAREAAAPATQKTFTLKSGQRSAQPTGFGPGNTFRV